MNTRTSFPLCCVFVSPCLFQCVSQHPHLFYLNTLRLVLCVVCASAPVSDPLWSSSVSVCSPSHCVLSVACVPHNTCLQLLARSLHNVVLCSSILHPSCEVVKKGRSSPVTLSGYPSPVMHSDPLLPLPPPNPPNPPPFPPTSTQLRSPKALQHHPFGRRISAKGGEKRDSEETGFLKTVALSGGAWHRDE